MPTLGEDEAAALIRPHQLQLGEVVRQALAALTRYRQDLHIFTRRTRANIVRDHMVNNAVLAFDGIPDVVPTFRKGRFFLAFGADLLIQLKKLNRRRRPRNYPTRQAIDIENQRGNLHDPRQLWLFDIGEMPAPTVATAGYKLGRLDQLEEVAVVCHAGEQMLWKLDLPDALSERPAVGQMPPQSPPPTRVVPREGPATEERQTSDGEPR